MFCHETRYCIPYKIDKNHLLILTKILYFYSQIFSLHGLGKLEKVPFGFVWAVLSRMHLLMCNWNPNGKGYYPEVMFQRMNEVRGYIT